uniref:Transmembrane protein n=1 Tax=Globodera pallida TaxID=36090 RepID=A0A183BIK7_GLOPA
MLFTIFEFVFIAIFFGISPNLGFNHFLKCSSLYVHEGRWDMQMYDLVNEVSGSLKATEELRNISCISYGGSRCLNATCLINSAHDYAYLGYHHCVFNGEYDFCERFIALCGSQNGFGAYTLCVDHHCNVPPEGEPPEGPEGHDEADEAEELDGFKGAAESKGSKGAAGDKRAGHDERTTQKKAAKTAHESEHPFAHLLSAKGRAKEAGTELAEEKQPPPQRQAKNAGGAAAAPFGILSSSLAVCKNKKPTIPINISVFVAAAATAFVGFRTLRARGFFAWEKHGENLI